MLTKILDSKLIINPLEVSSRMDIFQTMEKIVVDEGYAQNKLIVGAKDEVTNLSTGIDVEGFGIAVVP